MKRYLPFIVLAFGVAYLASTVRIHPNKAEFDLNGFGRIPILINGRIKPLDTVARTSLLTLQGRQRVSTPERAQPFVASPDEWLADVLFAPDKADSYPTFRIDSPEVLSLMGISEEDTRIHYDTGAKRTLAILGFLPSTQSRFSYSRLRPKLPELERQARMAEGVEDQIRTPFQRAVIQLRDRIILYLQLKTSVQMPDSPDFLSELVRFEKALPAGVNAVLAKQKGQEHDEDAVKVMMELNDRYSYMEEMGNLRAIPPAADDKPEHWRPVGAVLREAFATGQINPNVMAYAALGHAWRARDASQFNEIVGIFHNQLDKRHASDLRRSDVEFRFNAAEPFYSAMILYAFAFLIAVASWLFWPDALGRSALWLIEIAWLASTVGIATRMWLEGRPPVTNLYSSALFVGWGAVLLCIVLERIYRNAIGSVAGGMIGFATLLIAHHLALGGDTLEMMRAVLDSNFWLATHVVVITTGYAATFLAGFLAIIYIIRGVLTRSLDDATADALTRMVYGIVCFATLFSLIGTILGGIWADQSWGRFWGWDPKENGALIIVIWNAVILHARWGGMVKQRGLMMLAVFGNIVTSWSWFGVNMLGVGLHSYGFMDKAFYWLVGFVISQLVIIGLAALPRNRWRSAAA